VSRTTSKGAPTNGSTGRSSAASDGAGSRARRGTDSVIGILVKILGLGLVAAVALWVAPTLVATEKWFGLVVVCLGAAGLFAVYSTQRLVPLKYLLPGTLFLLAMIVYPVIATIQISFTNFGDGKRLTKDESIAAIVGSSVTQAPDSTLYNLTVGTTGSPTEGPFTFFLVQPESGDLYSGTAEGLEELAPADVTVTDEFVTEASAFTMLTPKQVNDAGAAVGDLAIPTDRGAIRSQGVRKAFRASAT